MVNLTINKMHRLLIFLIILFTVLILLTIKPIKAQIDILKNLNSLKIHTVNMLNKTLKVDTSKLIDFHVPDVHCGGIINNILSPEELLKLSHDNLDLYNKLVSCGYTRTVGLLHGFALWSSMSKTKDMKSFQYFVDCINHIKWSDPNLFENFHSTKSKIGKCII